MEVIKGLLFIILIFMGVFMTQIEKSNSNMEITVNSANGEAYISQRKAAELLGVPRSSLQSYIERSLHPVNSELDQGLSSEIFAICVQYYALDARNPTSEAKKLLPNDIKENKAFYPSEETFNHLEVYNNLGQKWLGIYNDLYLQFKMYRK